MTREPLDVVIATGDRDFRRVTSALLANEGCRVQSSGVAPDRIRRLVEARRPDVLILDADLATVQRVAAMARDGGHSLGLVSVTDRNDRREGLTIERMGSAEDLLAAVEQAAAAARARVTPPTDGNGRPGLRLIR